MKKNSVVIINKYPKKKKDIFMQHALSVYKYYKDYYDNGIKFKGDFIYKMKDWKEIIYRWGHDEIERLYEMIIEHESEFYT